MTATKKKKSLINSLWVTNKNWQFPCFKRKFWNFLLIFAQKPSVTFNIINKNESKEMSKYYPQPFNCKTSSSNAVPLYQLLARMSNLMSDFGKFMTNYIAAWDWLIYLSCDKQPSIIQTEFHCRSKMAPRDVLCLDGLLVKHLVITLSNLGNSDGKKVWFPHVGLIDEAIPVEM